MYWMTGSLEICHHILCRLIPWSVGFVSASSVPFFFWSRPTRKTNDREGSCEHNSQLSVNCIHISLCFLLLPIQCRCTLTWRWSCLWKCSGSYCRSLIRLWIFSRRPNVVIPGNIFHSNSVGIPSIRFKSLNWLFFRNHLILLFQVAIGSSPIFQTQSTESENVGFDVDLVSFFTQ